MLRHALRSALILAIPFAVGCGGGGGGGNSSPTQPQPSTLVVEVRDFAFDPKSIVVQPGDTVVWRLAGSDHTHTVMAVGGMFGSGFVFTQSGATFEHTFTADDAGKTFEYFCQTHHLSYAMQGSVRVGESAPPPKAGY